MTTNKQQKIKCNINLESLRGLPIRAHIYWKNTEGFYLGSNDLMLEKAGFSNVKDLVDRTDINFPVPEAEARLFQQEDKLVMQCGTPMQFYNAATLLGGKINFLTIKTPMFDQDNHIIGVFGFSQYIEDFSANNSLSLLSNAGVLIKSITVSENIFSEIPNNFDLTKRERTCLFYFARGRTALEIANLFCISKRTVEKHIAQIKIKLQCTTRSQLVDKAIKHGLIDFLPVKFG